MTSHFVVISEFAYEGQQLHAVFSTVEECRALLEADKLNKYPDYRFADIQEWEGTEMVKEWPLDPNKDAIVITSGEQI